MTNNQIQYANLLETKRSNLAREAETKRHNIADETETHRANVVREDVAYKTLDETVRHNQAGETIAMDTLAETKRHNIATEEHNRNVLAETSRHNKAQESIGYQQISLGYAQLAEQSRANKASEALRHETNMITNASNVFRNLETSRHNRATEKNQISVAQIQAGASRYKTEADFIPKLIDAIIPF